MTPENDMTGIDVDVQVNFTVPYTAPALTPEPVQADTSLWSYDDMLRNAG